MYMIQEIQTTGDNIGITPAIVKADKKEADSVFYLALGAAAISAVPVHAVVMFDEHGNVEKTGFYEHRN